MKDCGLCRSAYTDEELRYDNDLSYIPIGLPNDGYRAFIRSGDKKPTALLVEKGNDLVWVYKPKFCPNCGRELIENNKTRKSPGA